MLFIDVTRSEEKKIGTVTESARLTHWKIVTQNIEQIH